MRRQIGGAMEGFITGAVQQPMNTATASNQSAFSLSDAMQQERATLLDACAEAVYYRDARATKRLTHELRTFAARVITAADAFLTTAPESLRENAGEGHLLKLARDAWAEKAAGFSLDHDALYLLEQGAAAEFPVNF